MPSRITHVALRDFRSIASCDVELQPLTLLVGPNGSGKSNFLNALGFLVHSMHRPLDDAFEGESGINSLLRKLPGGRLARSFSIQVRFELEDMTPGTYSITVGEGPNGGALIEKERCEVGAENFSSTQGIVANSTVASPAFVADRPALVSFGALSQFAPVFNLLAGMRFYSPNPARMRRPASIGPGRLLLFDASNAADVLARLESLKPEVTERIAEYLHAFNSEFAGVTVNDNGSYRWLEFTPASNPSKWKLNGADVSDGTLRALGILLAIFQRSSVSPIPLIGLEEPESNLHPAAAGVLLDALMEASSQVTIIASTHSADLLDRKDLPVEAVLAFALHDGETVIGPVNEGGKSILREKLYTAGELLRNNQLTPSPVSAAK